MAGPYDTRFRQRVVKAYLNNKGFYREIARLFDVGSASVKRWVAQMRAQGHVRRKPMGGARRERLIQEEHLTYLKHLLENEATWTLRELAEELLETFDLRVSQDTISRALRENEYTCKRGSSEIHVSGRGVSKSEGRRL